MNGKRGVLWCRSQGEVGDVVEAQLIGEITASQVEAQVQIYGFWIRNAGPLFAGGLSHSYHEPLAAVGLRRLRVCRTCRTRPADDCDEHTMNEQIG